MASYVESYVGRDVRIQPSPGVPQYMWKRHPLIDIIFKDTKEWQGMPNRQDPITHAMIESLRKGAIGMHKHCHNSAIADWCTLGESTGYRGKEWCQTKDPIKNGYTLYDKPSAKFKNRIYACCDTDFQFKLKAPPHRTISLHEARKLRVSLLLSVLIKWRYQKIAR